MNIAHCDRGIYIEFNENRVNVLVVENASALSEIINELYIQSEGGDGDFVIAQKDELFKFSSKVSVVLEPFSVSFNEKKILTALYKEMEKEALEYLYTETCNLNSAVVNYIDLLSSKMPYPIVFNDSMDIQSVLKAVHTELDDGQGSICEKIINYIKVISVLTGIRIVIFLNLKSFISEDELKEIYKCAFYNKIYLLLIENFLHDKIECEDTLIIDKDLCFIKF